MSRLEVSAYLLVAGAAVARVLLPLLAPQHLAIWLVAAALAWGLAFALYLLVFAPWLVATRLDGKDG
ncbi:NnrS protein [compost metagenome]